VSDEPTFETDPAVWALQHPKNGVMVTVTCPRSKGRPHVVAEIQETPFGSLLKVYQRDGRPRSPMQPTGEPYDLSRLVNKPGQGYSVDRTKMTAHERAAAPSRGALSAFSG